MAEKHDPRHVARALAMQHLFSTTVTKSPPVETEVLLQELEEVDYNQELYTKLVEGVEASINTLDPIVKKLAPAWPIEQIAPVDITLLRMGIWEAFIGKLNPAKVVINEMIELGREFGGEKTSPFVNGVLGALLLEENKHLLETIDEQDKSE